MNYIPQLDPEYQKTLREVFYQSTPGSEAQLCIQCGTCSGSCPLAHEMDLGPRRILALLRDGYVQEVLESRSIWLCLSCNACLTRCPREIPVPDIMYQLRVLAVQHGLSRKEYRVPDLYQVFVQQAEKRGRISEARLAARYGMSHPRILLGRTNLALKLLRRGRV